jgi:hypothetical protein
MLGGVNRPCCLHFPVDVDQEGRAIAVWRRGPDTDERDLWANRFE